MLRSIHYYFKQRFNFPAQEAYGWCTDFTPEDQKLMQETNATREVQCISEDVILLIDTFNGENKTITKQKLVCLYPKQLKWASTHLTGPNKHSQFLYEIVPEGNNTCHLEFTALHLDYDARAGSSKSEAEARARELMKIDSDTWKVLAVEMEKELREK
jgi:hypothetical protein